MERERGEDVAKYCCSGYHVKLESVPSKVCCEISFGFQGDDVWLRSFLPRILVTSSINSSRDLLDTDVVNWGVSTLLFELCFVMNDLNSCPCLSFQQFSPKSPWARGFAPGVGGGCGRPGTSPGFQRSRWIIIFGCNDPAVCCFGIPCTTVSICFCPAFFELLW